MTEYEEAERNMKIIDTHCHPQFPQFDADRDEVVCRALDAGIGIICVGTDLATSRQAIKLAERYEGLYASVGLHPNEVTDNFQLTSYEELLKHSKAVAIGEVGLDYYRTTDLEKRKLQRESLEQFIHLAAQCGKPVIIHCRDAHEDMMNILPEYRGVMHSFTGTAEQARRYMKRGYFIGLNGIVTFAKEYEEMVRSIPLDRLLLETDAPYLAPAPYRGKRNEPSYVDIVGRSIATIFGIEPAVVFEATMKNAEHLFNI